LTTIFVPDQNVEEYIKTDVIPFVEKILKREYDDKNPAELFNITIENLVTTRLEKISENLWNVLGINNVDFIRDSFVEPVTGILSYFINGSKSNHGFGILKPDDQKSINLISTVRFLHEVAENFELITEGLKNAGFQDDQLNKLLNVTNFVITQINNGLLFYVGWTADQIEIYVPAAYRFENILVEIIQDTLGGNYVNTSIFLENEIVLMNTEIEDLTNLLQSYKPDYLEDALETLQDLFANTGRLFASLNDELPEEYRNDIFNQISSVLDIGANATTVPMLISNILGIFTHVVGAYDNIQEISTLL